MLSRRFWLAPDLRMVLLWGCKNELLTWRLIVD